jgi:hypothetical protein
LPLTTVVCSLIVSFMRKLEEIEQQIRGLSASDFAELREWILEQDWTAWDKQIESDQAAGKLRNMVSEAKAEFDPGKTRKL